MANEKTINARLQQKHDIKAHWKLAAHFIPKAGEIIVYDDLNKIKIGDGTTYVNELPFVNGSVGEKHINENGEEKGEIFNDYANNTADGEYSHAEGQETTAGGEASHAEGYNTKTAVTTEFGYLMTDYKISDSTNRKITITLTNASGIQMTHALAFDTDNDDLNAVQADILEIDSTQNKITLQAQLDSDWNAMKDISLYDLDRRFIYILHHPELGTVSRNGASYAHAEGNSTQALGEASHSEGKDTQATRNYSHASGLGTIASEEAQTVIGKYNQEDSNALFIVGNGTSEATSDRKNAFTVNKDGSATLAKVGENNNNIATVGYVNEAIAVNDSVLITIADIDTICGGNIVAASEVTF